MVGSSLQLFCVWYQGLCHNGSQLGFAYLVACCLAITSSTLGWWPLWDWSPRGTRQSSPMPMLLEEAIRPLPRLLRHKQFLDQCGGVSGTSVSCLGGRLFPSTRGYSESLHGGWILYLTDQAGLWLVGHYGPTVCKQGSREAEKPGSREADTSGRREAAKPGRQEATKPENPLPSPTSPRLETCGPAEHNASAAAVLRLPASPLLHEAQEKNASSLRERLATWPCPLVALPTSVSAAESGGGAVLSL